MTTSLGLSYKSQQKVQDCCVDSIIWVSDSFCLSALSSSTLIFQCRDQAFELHLQAHGSVPAKLFSWICIRYHERGRGQKEHISFSYRYFLGAIRTTSYVCFGSTYTTTSIYRGGLEIQSVIRKPYAQPSLASFNWGNLGVWILVDNQQWLLPSV